MAIADDPKPTPQLVLSVLAAALLAASVPGILLLLVGLLLAAALLSPWRPGILMLLARDDHRHVSHWCS